MSSDVRKIDLPEIDVRQIDVRQVTASEIGGYVEQMAIGFHYEAAEGLSDYYLEQVDLDRTWAAFDGSNVVGTLRSFATDLTVPGPALVPAAALTNVTVAPTHRRRGLLTEMITADLRESAERGEVVGILIASEYPIYGRFGYGPAIEGAKWTIDTPGLRFVTPAEGSVELIDLPGLRKVGPEIYERARLAQPGYIERPDHWWDRTLRIVPMPGAEKEESRQAVYRSPTGELEGHVRYHVASDWDDMRPKCTLKVKELLAATPAAYRRLWEYCCSVDLVTTIEAGDRPVDEVLPLLLTDGRQVKQTGRYDFIWARVLDVPGFFGSRRYASAGTLVLEVVDPLGFAAGRFEIDGGPDHAECRPSKRTADLTLPVHLLGAVSMGGLSLSRLAAAGVVDEHRSGAAAAADAMLLSARSPWCSTWF